MCTKLHPQAYAIRDEVTHIGDYGLTFMILLQGEVVVHHADGLKLRSRYFRKLTSSRTLLVHPFGSPFWFIADARVESWLDDNGDEKEALAISADDMEPIVGFAAFLPGKHKQPGPLLRGV